jgi:uncharacterized protein YndB with AHSA1/START domain
MFEGYLLIADISGYTMYLSKSELDHAEKTLTALLELLVEQTRPPLVISRLDGDAVASYGLRSSIMNGQTLVEMLENTYVAFRKAIERMVLNTTCQCNACANISSLDLKFFLHYGTFAIQHISVQNELVGSDVILIHRLLKNRVQEEYGFRAYTLYTDAAIRQLGLTEIDSTLVPHTESYEHIGEVKVWVQNMQPVWENKKTASQVTIPADEIAAQLETEIEMPPEVLWDYLNTTDFRSTLMASDHMEVTNRLQGRIGPGSVYQCYHGDEIVPQTVLEWQPFERILIQQLLPIPLTKTTILSEFQLVPSEGGTKLVCIDSKARGPLPARLLVYLMMKRMEKKSIENLLNFKEQIEADYKTRYRELAAESELSK